MRDLRKKKDIILRLVEKYNLLITKFEAKDVENHYYNAFNDLHTDIYDSITKVDLFRIYKNKISDVVEIYNTFKFLKERDVGFIYREYLEKIDKHDEKHKDDPIIQFSAQRI
jgi:hypothetical protein